MWPSAPSGLANAVEGKRRLVVCGLVLAALLLLLFFPASADAQQGTVFKPSDKTPPKGQNPCPRRVVPNDVYDDFKDLVAEVLSAAGGVPADIDAQVKRRVPAAKQAPVDVEIFVADLATFQTEYADDVDSLSPGKTQQQLKDEATGIFNRFAAFTYISDKKNAAGKSKIKIKVFCKDSFRTSIIDKAPVRELLIHELVHAKLFTMNVLGLADTVPPLPFKNHDDDPTNDATPGKHGGDKEFYDEVRRLFDLLKKNLKLSYAPGTTFSSEALATLLRFDAGGAVVGRTTLIGVVTVEVGHAGDRDGDGLLEVPTEIVALALTGDGFSARLNPFHPSPGTTEEQSGGHPFPAASSFDLAYLISDRQGGTHSRRSTVQATVTEWPPLDQTYVNPAPSGPLDLERLTLLDTDRDGDGLRDRLDPDDDNDGIPDVEDPRPAHAGS